MTAAAARPSVVLQRRLRGSAGLKGVKLVNLRFVKACFDPVEGRFDIDVGRCGSGQVLEGSVERGDQRGAAGISG
jgi:hypothetical protein